jgi:hypothetical protein
MSDCADNLTWFLNGKILLRLISAAQEVPGNL